HAHRTKHAPVNAQKTHSKTMQMYIPHRMGIFSPVVKSVKSMQTQTPFLADTWIGEMNNRSNAQPKDYNFHKMIYTHARSMLIKTYEELASAKNGLITAQSQSKVIEMELQKIKNALEDEKDYIDELNTEIDEYIAECQNKTEELVKKNAMLQKVQIDLDQCVEKRNEYLRSIEELVQNATAEKTQADKKLNELYKQNDQLNTKYNKLLEEKKKLEKKQEELQEEKITLQKKQERLQEEKSVLQKGQKELKQQIYQCEKQNMEKQAALESRLKKITEENNILTEQLAKIKEMTQSIVHANKTIDQLEQDKKDLTLTILNLEKRIEDLDNSIALDRKKIEKLSNENENERVEKDKRIKHLEDRQKELETQKETLDSTQQEMETQYNTLNNKYITLQQDLEKSMAAQNDVNAMKKKNSFNNKKTSLENIQKELDLEINELNEKTKKIQEDMEKGREDTQQLVDSNKELTQRKCEIENIIKKLSHIAKNNIPQYLEDIKVCIALIVPVINQSKSKIQHNILYDILNSISNFLDVCFDSSNINETFKTKIDEMSSTLSTFITRTQEIQQEHNNINNSEHRSYLDVSNTYWIECSLYIGNFLFKIIEQSKIQLQNLAGLSIPNPNPTQLQTIAEIEDTQKKLEEKASNIKEEIKNMDDCSKKNTKKYVI
ncbi:hypothetical protein NEFER01_1397, partial [Nematocida sp. LUAm1]